jgi:hypothetical protein
MQGDDRVLTLQPGGMTAAEKRLELATVERVCARLRRELAELEESEVTRDWIWRQSQADVQAFDEATGAQP